MECKEYIYPREKVRTKEGRRKLFEEYVKHLETKPPDLFESWVEFRAIESFVERYPEEFGSEGDGKDKIRLANQKRLGNFYDTLMKNTTGEYKGNAGVCKLMAYNILKYKDQPTVIEQTNIDPINPSSVEAHEAEAIGVDDKSE